jgi:hypothetical protein
MILIKKLWSIYKYLLFIIPVFVIHLVVFQNATLSKAAQDFYYSIPFLYLLYIVFSKIILFVIVKVSEKNFDNTGMTFLVCTTIKMAISYFIARPILNAPAENTIEQANFFFIFILYLAIETLITIRLLNKRQ